MRAVNQYYRALSRNVAPAGTPFISTWRTSNTSAGSSTSTQVKLPLINSGVYDFTVDWGDTNSDVITVWSQSEVTHTYGSTGDYVITITGICEGWAFAATGDRLKILDISQWGSVKFSALAFHGCSNLNVTATDAPLFYTSSIASFFGSCSSLVGNSSFNNWDVSGITNFESVFFLATSFNQNIGAWDVSAGTTFSQMFRQATAFNNGGSSDINNWSPGSAIIMSGMFFAASVFNQPIGNWDVSNVTNFQGIFRQAGVFNQNLSSWNVGSATNMTEMFYIASAFNNGGDSGINNWNVSNVLTMNLMFQQSAFNQPIGNWDVSGVTNFNAMLYFMAPFNQNIGAWNVGAGTNFVNFMNLRSAAQYLAANLDAIYNGWTNFLLQTARTIGFGTIKYTAAGTPGRALLTRTNATVSISNAANNGSGLIRITTGSAHGRTTGEKIFISGVTGAAEANGGWIVTVIDATTLDLQASTFTNTYISGGTVRTGYGWTVTDGGI